MRMKVARRHRLRQRLLLLAGLSAGGVACEGVQLDGRLVDKPTPPMTVREPLAPGAAGLAWAAPDSYDGEWVIGPQGVGPLLVGAGSSSTAPDGTDGDTDCVAVARVDAPGGVVEWVVGGRIVALVVTQPGPSTLGSISVGDDASAPRRYYGSRLRQGDAEDRGWLVADPPPLLAGHPIAFQVSNGLIQRIRVGASSPGGECR